MCPSSCPTVRIAETARVAQLLDLADVVQDHARQQQIEIDIGIMRGRQFRQVAQRQHVLDQSRPARRDAPIWPPEPSETRAPSARHETSPRSNAFRCGLPIACDPPAQLPEHLVAIALRSRKVIAEIDFGVRNPRDFVHGELRPVLKNLVQTLDANESRRARTVSSASAALSHIFASSSPVRSTSVSERYGSPDFFWRTSLCCTRNVPVTTWFGSISLM